MTSPRYGILRPRRRRGIGRFALAALAALALGATPARASTAFLSGAELNISGDPDADVITVSTNGTVVTITDTGPGGIVAQTGCDPVNLTTITCAVGDRPLSFFAVNLSEGRDTFTNQNLAVRGGIFAEGNEPKTINAGPGDQNIEGGTGDDTIDGGEGSDSLLGGNDGFGLDPTQGNDLLRGGPGTDFALYGVSQPVTVTLDGQANDGQAGEADNVQVENVASIGSGSDTLVGDGADNLLVGGAGDDALRGQGGNDWLVGDLPVGVSRGTLPPGVNRGIAPPAGNDTLDGGAGTDDMNCGIGFDLVLRDPLDAVAANCERTGARVAGDSARVTGKKKNKAKVRISCPESELQPCTGKLAVTADEKRIGKGKFSVPNGQTKRAKVKLNKKGRKALRRAKGRLLVTVEATTNEPGGVSIDAETIFLHPRPARPGHR